MAKIIKKIFRAKTLIDYMVYYDTLFDPHPLFVSLLIYPLFSMLFSDIYENPC